MENNYTTASGVSPEECPFLTTEHVRRMTIYRMFFDSIGKVQLFLGDDPPVNKKVFLFQRSTMGGAEFAGDQLPDAIRYCVGGYEKGFGDFLKLAQQLETVNVQKFEQKKVITSFVGHRPNVPAYIAGAPKNMYRRLPSAEKKVINIFMQVAFDNRTTELQIRNRGILALNLIRLLERNDYIVNFRLFEASQVYNEVFLCEVVLKKPGEKLEPKKCYYPMCGKEFVRRILLRIKESLPVKENWYMSYGKICEDAFTKKMMNIGPNDIYIGTPQQMGILGTNIYEDADAFLDALGMDGKIVIPKYQHTIQENAKKFDEQKTKKGR